MVYMVDMGLEAMPDRNKMVVRIGVDSVWFRFWFWGPRDANGTLLLSCCCFVILRNSIFNLKTQHLPSRSQQVIK